jgi:hypothetical protein
MKQKLQLTKIKDIDKVLECLKSTAILIRLGLLSPVLLQKFDTNTVEAGAEVAHANGCRPVVDEKGGVGSFYKEAHDAQSLFLQTHNYQSNFLQW